MDLEGHVAVELRHPSYQSSVKVTVEVGKEHRNPFSEPEKLLEVQGANSSNSWHLPGPCIIYGERIRDGPRWYRVPVILIIPPTHSRVRVCPW